MNEFNRQIDRLLFARDIARTARARIIELVIAAAIAAVLYPFFKGVM